MKLFDSIKNAFTIPEESQAIYNEILNIYNELKKEEYTITAKNTLYNKMIELLQTMNKNDFQKIVKKQSSINSYGANTPFGWYSSINYINVDFLINTCREKIKKNDTYIENLNVFNNLLNKIEKHEIIKNNKEIEKQKLANLDDIKISNITKSFNKSQMIKYVIIDVETTGLKAQTDEIIELTAIKVVDGDPVESFSTLIKPKKDIPKDATEVNHITNEMVADAPNIESVIEDFDNFVSGCNIVGHNIIFDLKFLYCNGSKILNQKGIKIYDTVELSKKVFKDRDNYKLDNICKENLQIIREDAHRSLSDSLATYYLFEACVELITSNE